MSGDGYVLGDDMRRAVELATVVEQRSTLPPGALATVVLGAVRDDAARALVAQAVFAGAIGRLAEAAIDRALADVEILRVALDRALGGAPVTAEQLGMSREQLFRTAGLAAARLGTVADES